MTRAPVRVLWLTKGLGPGGAERLLVEQAASGDRTAFAYEAAYLLPWKQHLVADLEALDVPTHCLGVRNELDARWLARLRRLIAGGPFDIVHAHSPLSASMARVLVRVGAPSTVFVDTEHNRWPSHNPATRLMNRATFRLNDAAIAVSEEVVASMPASLGAGVTVLTHGIDLDRVRSLGGDRAATRAELGVGPGELLCVTVANLRENKRYPDLLAAARVVADRGAPVRFVAVGQGPLEGEIRALRDRLDLGATVELLGYRADAIRIIAAADLFVLSSGHEGLPVALMEAFALGVAPVATAVGGVAEAVVDGVNGLLVAPGDPPALAAAILRCTDPGLRAALAAGAAASAERFSARTAVAEIEAVYRRALERKASAARR